jgi:hypothetical protein
MGLRGPTKKPAEKRSPDQPTLTTFLTKRQKGSGNENNGNEPLQIENAGELEIGETPNFSANTQMCQSLEINSVCAVHSISCKKVSITTDATTSSPVGLCITSNDSSLLPKACYSETLTTITEYYMGLPVNLQALLKNNECLHEVRRKSKANNHTRSIVQCKLCHEHEESVLKYSANGTLPFAHGCRVDGQMTLKRLIAHLKSKPHEEAERLNNLKKQWEAGSEKHPWMNVLMRHQASVIQSLIHMAVDVYNDTQCETVSARSWPSRSLAQMHADKVVSNCAEGGYDCPFIPFSATGSDLHYRDPVKYTQMLECVYEIELDKLIEKLRNCVVFSLQLDGSCDRMHHDKKYITLRLVNEKETEPRSYFVSITEPEQRGAYGLLEAITDTFKSKGNGEDGLPEDLLTSKCIGLTTDGESANTGRKAGLWVLLEQHLKKELFLVWCVCHRTDLAYDSLEVFVPEVKHWRQNLTAVCSYFRMSPAKYKALRKIATSSSDEDDIDMEVEDEEFEIIEGSVAKIKTQSKLHHFPKDHNVRMAQHLRNVCAVVLNNLPYCVTFWKEVTADSSSNLYRKNEIAEAKGFLKIWQDDTRQKRLTQLMMDVLQIQMEAEKLFQRSKLIITDVPRVVKNVVSQLDLMMETPFPGGMEEQCENADTADDTSKRRVANKYVTFQRSYAAVRTEIVQTMMNFYGDKMNIEQEDLINKITKLLNSSSINNMIENGRGMIEGLFGKTHVSQFAVDVVNFANEYMEEYVALPTLSDKVHFLAMKGSGCLSKLAAAFIVVSPHSMLTERAVSHQNIIKSVHKGGMTLTGVHQRTFISLNGIGTAFYDPRAAVSKFLLKCERRYREPVREVYEKRAFVCKFFSNDNLLV